MDNKTSSNKLVLYNTLSTVLLYTITFFSAPLFSRVLGTEEYGVVQVYNTWVSFFTVILGLYTRGTLSIAKVNLIDEEFKEYQSSVLFLSVVGFGSIFVLLLAFQRVVIGFFGLGIEYLVIMLIHSFGVYCVYFINTKFTYEMKARNNMIISVSLALINFGLSYLLVRLLHTEHLYTGRIIGMAIPYAISGVIIVTYIFTQGKVFYSKRYWRFCLPLCLPLVFHGIAGIICSSSDRIMIQKMIGLAPVGIYGLACNFANIMDSVWNALQNSWNPFFFEFVKQDQLCELKSRSANYIRVFTCLCIGFILLAPEVYRCFASEEYWEGLQIIPVIVLSTYSVFVYSFAANYEFCFKRTDIVAVGSVASGVVNIVLNLLFINLAGYIGAAIATVLSNILLAFVHICFARRLVKEKWVYEPKMFIPAVSGLSSACIIFYTFIDCWIVRWLYAIIVGVYMIFKMYKTRSIF